MNGFKHGFMIYRDELDIIQNAMTHTVAMDKLIGDETRKYFYVLKATKKRSLLIRKNQDKAFCAKIALSRCRSFRYIENKEIIGVFSNGNNTCYPDCIDLYIEKCLWFKHTHPSVMVVRDIERQFGVKINIKVLKRNTLSGKGKGNDKRTT